MSKEKQIEGMTKFILELYTYTCEECDKCGKWQYEDQCDDTCFSKKVAEAFYNAGYRKQNDEELIDKIATYFEKEDNWTKLKYAWNVCGKSVQLRDMLRDAITEAKMKGGAE